MQLGQDIDGAAADDCSGYSVSLSSDGTVVAIGANGNDRNGDWSGHTRIYSIKKGLGIEVTEVGKTHAPQSVSRALAARP